MSTSIHLSNIIQPYHILNCLDDIKGMDNVFIKPDTLDVLFQDIRSFKLDYNVCYNIEIMDKKNLYDKMPMICRFCPDDDVRFKYRVQFIKPVTPDYFLCLLCTIDVNFTFVIADVQVAHALEMPDDFITLYNLKREMFF